MLEKPRIVKVKPNSGICANFSDPNRGMSLLVLGSEWSVAVIEGITRERCEISDWESMETDLCIITKQDREVERLGW